jgi:hypothetical protein
MSKTLSHCQKVAVVTNGTTNIGIACITELLNNNFHVVYLDFKKIADKKIAENPNVTFYNCELGCSTNIKKVIGNILDIFTRIDCVINILVSYPLSTSVFDVDIEKLKKLTDINLTSNITLCKSTYDELNRRNGIFVTFYDVLTVFGRDIVKGHYEVKINKFVPTLLPTLEDVVCEYENKAELETSVKIQKCQEHMSFDKFDPVSEIAKKIVFMVKELNLKTNLKSSTENDIEKNISKL